MVSLWFPYGFPMVFLLLRARKGSDQSRTRWDQLLAAASSRPWDQLLAAASSRPDLGRPPAQAPMVGGFNLPYIWLVWFYMV